VLLQCGHAHLGREGGGGGGGGGLLPLYIHHRYTTAVLTGHCTQFYSLYVYIFITLVLFMHSKSDSLLFKITLSKSKSDPSIS
jgi:hypothetical protein